MDFEKWCEERGFNPSDMNQAAKTSLQAAWKAEAGGGTVTVPAPTTTGVKSLDDILAEANREEDRKRKITEMVYDEIRSLPDHSDKRQPIATLEALGKQAIEGKWAIEKFEVELLRARRPNAPTALSAYERPVDAKVLEAAACLHAGLPDAEKHYDERTLEAASRQWKHGLSLNDLILTCAARGGYRGLSVKQDLAGALRAAFAADIRATGSWGPSTTGALSGILSNVANKFLRIGFDSVENVWRSFSAIRTANDFKQISTYSLTGDLTYEQLPPGGEIPHGQLTSTSYTNQVATYARMMGLDRRDLINDDLGALTQTARRLGRGGALKLNLVFWGGFLNNSTFFTAGRNNVSTGAGSALSLAGLDAANQKFLTQTDPDGNPLGIVPKILLVPPALAVTAKTLMMSTALVSGATTVPGTPSTNIWASMFSVATSAYMQNANLTGNSAAAWYLLADPNDLPIIEVAFLNGQESPTVESAEADFSMLGIAFRGYYDFGIGLQEYRAGVRSAGS